MAEDPKQPAEGEPAEPQASEEQPAPEEQPAAEETAAPDEPAAEEPAAAEAPVAEETPAPAEPAAEQRPTPEGEKPREDVVPGAHLEPDLVLDQSASGDDDEFARYASEDGESEAAATVEEEAAPVPRSTIDLAADA